MDREKIERARKEVIGIIIDLQIHGWDKKSILNTISFNEDDLRYIDNKYTLTEKMAINIARDIPFIGITVEKLEEISGVDRAVFQEFIRKTELNNDKY